MTSTPKHTHIKVKLSVLNNALAYMCLKSGHQADTEVIYKIEWKCLVYGKPYTDKQKLL